MADDNRTKERILLVVGILLVAAGILINQWSVGWLLRPEGLARPISGSANKLIVWTFQALSIFAGYLLIKKRKLFTEEHLARRYRLFAGVFTAIFFGFIFMNAALYATSVIRASIRGIDPVSQKYGSQIRALYPNLDDAQFAEMMQESWGRGYSYEPFTIFKEGTHRGAYVNVDEGGFRHVKNQEPWPPKKANFNIFLFGNSTVFNYSLADEETIASRLQELLRQSNLSQKAAVYNFGRGFYYSSQERILYEKLLVGDFVPDVAVFVDGQTEFDQENQKLQGERPRFTDELEEFLGGGLNTKFLAGLPVVAWWRSFLANRNAELDLSSEITDAAYISDSIQENIRRYAENKKMIEAASSIYGVRPFFVWQPISSYGYDLSIQPFFNFDDNYRPTLGYRAMAEHVANNPMGDNFLYLADIQENVKKPIYVDGLHYSGWWSKEIAAQIADFLKARSF